MDALVLLVGAVLSRLHAAVGVNVCPGGWAWATTAFGMLVGLVPTAGAVTVAVLRRGRPLGGSTVTAIALLSCGLLPWLAFQATGQVFASGAGLGRPALRSLAAENCLGVTQRSYLGTVPVSDALGDGPATSALFAAPLVLFPVGVAVFVWMQGRLALRRGPRWPSRFFWLPILVLAPLTASMPAGATAQLWTGMLAGSIAGVVAVLMVPPPARAKWAGPRPAPKLPAPKPVAPKPAPPKAGAAKAGAPRVAAPRVAAPKVPAPKVPIPAPPAAVPVALAGTPAAVAALAAGSRRWLDGAPRRMRARLAATRAPLATRASGVAAVPMQRLSATLVAPSAGGPRFELVRRLGSGGFGGVWLAVDHTRREHVALKAAHAPDPDTEQRIRREARALSAVRHPSCVPIYDLVDSGSDPGLAGLRGLVIVMAYLDGCSLGELVHRHGTRDDVAVARLWLSLADALAAVHRQGVLHRDVKPANVLVDPAGQPHLIDFGIARARGDATLTLHGFVLGTPDYLAPEVARGEPATPSSDSWQLAATMSFALTGRPPRGGHDDAMSGLRAAAAAGPLSHLPTTSAHRELLRACLAEPPSARLSLDTVRAALDSWLVGSGAEPRRATTAPRRG